MAKLPTSSLLPPSCFALILLLSISRVFTIIDAAAFTVDLIPKDSLQSPSLSPYQRIRNSLKRSFHRAQLFGANYSQALAVTDVVADKGEFLMKFSIGTPPVQTLAIADTGSDLTWIQCKPCEDCYKQKPPLFDPAKSSSYKVVSCSSGICKSIVHGATCTGTKSTCGYRIGYGDRSTSKGDIATETLSFGGLSAPNFVMGCGHADQGTFSADTAGIVGLGGGKESLITQLHSSIHGKFSYCLIPTTGSATPSSKMNFGESGVVSGAGVVSTPLVSKSPPTYYYLTLEGISVGGKKLDYIQSTPSSKRASKAGGEGNIIIDSGTTLTFLPTEFFDKVVTAVKQLVKLKQVADPARLLSLCYEATEKEGGSKVPEMVVHFKGAEVKLKSVNTFLWTSEKTMCLAFASSTALNVPIYGNVAQLDFMVGYDLEKKTVSFKPIDCAAQN